MKVEHRYNVIKDRVRAAFTVRGSRFIAGRTPTATEEKARRTLLRHIGVSGGEIIRVDYGNRVILEAAVPPRAAETFEKGFHRLSHGRCRCEPLAERPRHPGG
jgi:putative IMPACT (imprinted ancient) family translation regulator